MGRWGVSKKLKNIYPHHYHAGLPRYLYLNYVFQLSNLFVTFPRLREGILRQGRGHRFFHA